MQAEGRACAKVLRQMSGGFEDQQRGDLGGQSRASTRGPGEKRVEGPLGMSGRAMQTTSEPETTLGREEVMPRPAEGTLDTTVCSDGALAQSQLQL